MINLSSILNEICPSIASALGGPLAGSAVSALSKALFGESSATKDKIAKSIEEMTPETFEKLKQAENNFIIEMSKIDLEKERLPYEDKSNARSREIEIEKAGHHDRTPSTLAYAVLSGFFIFIFLLLFIKIPSEMHDVIMIAMNTLMNVFVGITSYYFGTSASSKAKDALLTGSKQGAIKK